ncbi:MAG: TIGR00730 family Rossman fold protein [Bacteroidales bacterium]
MNSISTVCVYCASSSKVDVDFTNAAYNLGAELAEKGIRIVFGAGKCGLMGALAEGALKNNGEIVGVIPKFMYDEGWGNETLTRLEITASMHERKERMLHLADAVIALPGGCGTMEELMEAITWKQLGLFSRPIIILNTNGYYNPLINMLESAIRNLFMRDEHRNMWIVAETSHEAAEAIKNAPRWRDDARKIAAI